MTAGCPICGAPSNGLLCHTDTLALEHDLAEVPGIVVELDITLSKQARIGSGGKGGLARERMPIHSGAMLVSDDLTNTLTTWVRDLTDDQWRPGIGVPPASAAASHLLLVIDLVRRHPAVAELVDEINDAIHRARQVVDRPADRQYLGTCGGVHGDSIDSCGCCCHGRGIYAPPCDVVGGCGPHRDGVACTEELYAAPSAKFARCRTCGSEYDVADRREWMMDQAEDRIVTPAEAATVLADVGHMRVGVQRIRNYVDRKRITPRPSADGAMRFRLGDLLELIRAEGEKKAS